MLDLKQLKYFITCAETGSISEAAKLLYTTQPSVSKAIKALEWYCLTVCQGGFLLLQKGGRRIGMPAES